MHGHVDILEMGPEAQERAKRSIDCFLTKEARETPPEGITIFNCKFGCVEYLPDHMELLYHEIFHHEIMTQCEKCGLVQEPVHMEFHKEANCNDEEAGRLQDVDLGMVGMTQTERDAFARDLLGLKLPSEATNMIEPPPETKMI